MSYIFIIIICYVRKPICRCGLAGVVSLYKRAGLVVLVISFLPTNLPVLNTAIYVCVMCTTMLLCDCILDVCAKTKRRMPI